MSTENISKNGHYSSVAKSFSTFENYQNKYPHAKLQRTENGILTIELHDGQFNTIKWNLTVHEELGYLFRDVASDRENKVVIITGKGENFINPDFEAFQNTPKTTPEIWDMIMLHANELTTNLLNIQVPVIGVFNGPCVIHAEIAALSDIVIANENTYVADKGHFVYGIVPGDGVQIFWLELLGLNRGRSFLLTGETISASELQKLGVIKDVLPTSELMPKAMEYAELLAQKSTLTLRYTRAVLTKKIKELVQQQLPYGLALEGITDIKDVK